MLIDYLPESARVWIVRHALEHDSRRPVGKRTIDDVAVPGDPADVCSRPENILFTQIKNYLVRECHVYEITAAGMQDAFSFTCRPGRVQNEKRVFRIHHRSGTGCFLMTYQLVIADIPRCIHWDELARAAHHEYMFDAFRALDTQRHIEKLL